MKKRIYFLIVFASISILTLVALQIYWIKASIETHQQQFNQAVMNSLVNVVKKLEREEAITKVTSSLFKGEEINADFLSDSSFTIDKKELITPLEDDLPKSISEFSETKTDQLKINFIPPPQTDSSYFIIRKTQKRVLSSTIDYNTTGSGNKGSKKNATLGNDLINELALISVSKSRRERISYPRIDSLLASELLLNRIESNFVFDILDAETNELSFSEEPTASSELMQTDYRIELFPNDLYIESDLLMLYFPNRKAFVVKNSWKVLLISILLILILIALFYTSISTIFNQKKLSKVKNDFINNMTHELKTPISTISLACEALSDQTFELDKSQQQTYVGMVKEENKRLSILVDNVLKSATWDSGDLELKLENFNLHELINRVANSFKIQINQRGGSMTLNLEAEDDKVLADKIHLSNVIFNLLDNANKYSPNEPNITLSTKVDKDLIIFTVSDEGLGISKDEQKKIFDKFYRVSTGNVHDVKGFGLGLNYVKRIVDLHEGSVDIESIKGKGTSVIVNLKHYGE